MITINSYEQARVAAQKLLESQNSTLHEYDDKVDFMADTSQKAREFDAFHVVDISFLAERFDFWRQHLPNVTPFYAIKTNHDAVVVSVLAALGADFDCASINEVKQLQAIGVDPQRIIFANPRKSLATVEMLRSSHVTLLVFDSADELKKLIKHYPSAQIILRIATDDRHSLTPLSEKFGAPLPDAINLFDQGMKHGASIQGISFHVGSNCTNIASYVKAVRDAAVLFAHAKNKWGVHLSILDLGGGWPGADDAAFIAIAEKITDLVKELFPPNIKLMAEPGNFFAAGCTSAAIRIIGQTSFREQSVKHQNFFLANGIYGLFSNGYYHRQKMAELARWGWNFQPLAKKTKTAQLHKTTLWGPTCDATDKIVENLLLPSMRTEDWLYSHNIGSYAYSLQNNFNQIPPSKPFYIIAKLWE